MNMSIAAHEPPNALARELAELPLGTHGCLIYDTPEQMVTVVVPFLRLGLERNERCVCMLPPEPLAQVTAGLVADGVDVEVEHRRGALMLTAGLDFLVDGRFDADAMLHHLNAAIADSVAQGFAGLRATGDLAWEMGGEADLTLLPRYEAALDAALRGQPIVGLCLYRRADYPSETLECILRTHDTVCLNDDLVAANPFHEPSSPLGRGEWMAAQLRQAAEVGRRRHAELREEMSRNTRDRLARVLENMSDAFLSLDSNWRVTYANAEALRFSGHSAEQFVGQVIWEVCVEDVDGPVAQAFRQAAETGQSVRLEHLASMPQGDRWLDISAYPSPDGLNVFYRDITERKRAEERQMLLMREVDHRAKNALAVVQSIVMLSRADSMPEFVRAVEGRISALARVHTVLAAGKWSGAVLRDLVVEEVAAFAGRVTVDGPALSVTADAAQPLTMVLHELATNAAKYGALSSPDGRVEVSWRLQPGKLILHWCERGGPLVAPPENQGFGSRMIALAVGGQLDGEARFHWDAEGLHCSVTIAAHHLVNPLPDQPGAEPPASPPVQGSLDKVRVLVVEDDALLAMGMQMALESLGCRVIGHGATLEAALRLAAGEAMDVAVVDVNLRGRDSWPVADVLAARGLPYLFTTGYGDVGHDRGARVLRKPFRPDELAVALREVLAGQRGAVVEV